MSVIMSMIVEGDAATMEQYAGDHAAEIREIRDAAVGRGLIAHRFYGADGKIMVLDEWPDEQSFLTFFDEMGSKRSEPRARACDPEAMPRRSFCSD